MSDDETFLRAFESGALPNSAFHHRDHLRLTWLYLRRDGRALGTDHVLNGIRRFATAHGATDRFHVTLTLFWIRLVQHLMDSFPGVDRFEDLLTIFPPVSDKTIIFRHYSSAALSSSDAREAWLEPDLLPLP